MINTLEPVGDSVRLDFKEVDISLLLIRLERPSDPIKLFYNIYFYEILNIYFIIDSK